MRDIVHHHAVGVESPAECADRSFHVGDPALWKMVAVAIVEKRNYFLGQHAIQIITVAGILNVLINMSPPGTDRKAIFSVVGFRPPAIQHGAIQSAFKTTF